MLEFYKDGKPVTLFSIGSSGNLGQVIIFGQKVSFGERTNCPLAEYPYLSLFTIVESNKGHNGHYVLKDSNGKCFKLDKQHGTNYLYDAQQWLTWKNLYVSEVLHNKQSKIELLESHVALLKDILIKQGLHIVTEEQARKLNL